MTSTSSATNVVLEGTVTKTHETQTPLGENVLYFEVSNFSDPLKAGTERVVYRIVYESTSSLTSPTTSPLLPIHFGDKVVYNGKVAFPEEDKSITKGKIIEWNSIHPKSKPFFVACSSLDYIRNHIKNVFKDSDEKMIESMVDALQKAAKEEGLKSVSSYLTFCACKYIFLREDEDVSPNVNSMISKERFSNTVTSEREKKASADSRPRRGGRGGGIQTRVQRSGAPPTSSSSSSKYNSSSSSKKAPYSSSRSLIFSGGTDLFEDVAESVKTTKHKKTTTTLTTTSKAAEFIISITESKNFKPTFRGPHIMTPRQLELVLVTWNRNNCLRPFYLLGLTKSEVETCAKTLFLRSFVSPNFSSSSEVKEKVCECAAAVKKSSLASPFPWCGMCWEKPILSSGLLDYDDLINLYDLIVKCPFAFKAISMKKAIDIFHSHRPSSVSNVPKDHLFCGHLLRKLDEDKNSTCLEVTGSSFEESFNENESMLKCVYGVFTYTRPSSSRKFAYMFERFKVEKTISKFVSDCIVHSEQVEAHRGRKEKEIFSTLSDCDDSDEEDGFTGDGGKGKGYGGEGKIVLTEEQQKAVKAIVSSSGSPFPSVITVTGGPGVGKTTILKEVIKRFRENGIRYRVSSFTGKAVSRIKEKTRCKAKFASTLDRLIAKGDVFGFEHLIIDEASMVTSQLLCRFLMARKHATKKAGATTTPPPPPLKITFVGDPDQLPPIEWGNLFPILLDFPREWIPSFRLTAGFRLLVSPKTSSASSSSVTSADVIQNAFESIRNSSPGNLKKILEKDTGTSSSFLLIQNSKERGYEDVVCRIKQIKSTYKDSEASNFGIFSPYNQDVNIFNELIRDVFSSSSEGVGEKRPEEEKGMKRFEIGDRVIMTKNVYFPGNLQSSSDGEGDDEGDGGDDDEGDGGGFAYMNGDTGVVNKMCDTGIFVDFDTGPTNVFFQWETPSKKVIGEATESTPDLKMKAFEEGLKGLLLKTDEEWWGDDDDGDEGGANGGGGGDGSGGAIPLTEKILYVDLLKLAFSLTVHKSQGSEYDHVIVHIPRRYSPFKTSIVFADCEQRSFINRNLLYTALTRARKTVTIVTPGTFENEISAAILSKPPLRFGNLGHRVVDCLFERGFNHLIIAKDDEIL